MMIAMLNDDRILVYCSRPGPDGEMGCKGKGPFEGVKEATETLKDEGWGMYCGDLICPACLETVS